GVEKAIRGNRGDLQQALLAAIEMGTDRLGGDGVELPVAKGPQGLVRRVQGDRRLHEIVSGVEAEPRSHEGSSRCGIGMPRSSGMKHPGASAPRGPPT